jgi:hypothetical protein
MVLLLVVGLVAVIAVILIAVILSVRLGRNDDHEEPEDRHSERGHGRMDAGDPRRRDTRTPRPRPQAQDRRYRDRDDRRPDRDQAARSRDHDHPQRRPRRDAAPAGSVTDPRRPAGAGAGQPGSGRDNGGRRAGNGRSRHEATPAPYDTGPSPHLASDDFPSEPMHAADFPSGEFPSAPQHAADAPTARYHAVASRSGEFASEPLPAADFTSAEFPAADFTSAEFPAADFPSAEFPAADFPSAEFPAADFTSAEFPAADFPSEEMPAPSPRGRPAPPQADSGRGRSDSRRRPARGQDAPKGRSRQLRKRDDDDWPSMEWDKLTDEQYWAELSSDKPLATIARSPKPASEPTPAAARNGRPRTAAARPKPPAPAAQPAPPADGHTRAREVPGRPARTSPREPAPAREPVPMREPVAQEHEAVSRREPVTHERDAATERLPARPRQQPVARPRGDMPPAARPDATATPPGGEPSLAMLTSLATGPTRVPDDDPLTSPSFSRPTTDSRSYRTARTNTQASATANGTRPDGPPAEARYGNGATAGYGDTGHPAADYDAAAYASNGGARDHAQVNGTNGHARVNGAHDHTHVNGTYQLPDYADPGYAYLPAAPAATATPPAGTPQPADWYSAPAPAHTSRAQGNPYGSYVEPSAASYPSIPPAAYQDQQSSAAFPAYPGDQRGYQEPAYDAAAQLPYPTPAAAGAARPAGAPAHPSDAGQFPPPAAYLEGGYPEDGGYGNEYAGQAAYADTYGNAAYAPGYPAADYTADPYGQDGYDGYPADQG